ncbi:MAG: hypothetical protein A2268_06465 [Candidatus Raymondbacteria bacterium RifOxyA12_full_50_37]|uniref:Uncharacterized protein n=1 Tax=Candidatus Raymondbacteria bacterium RIFOXYD12_FULL_49_13 TaxID=1817890 RepID=A0A1F7EZH0_UNCRA|nr:MAG: hypothetical protein A2268_06465 [Candidatus Raymondbacteria bacterium RifOxyA12_full_50_37]OGJ92667.1 MAG: hypothetical protein A2350_03960 [Candidatus Raymondbacteria bacterium RifOxyB12_full_50_8]OGJ94455.1 MAG: hypothetical protein A2248_15395 [Candidatus Raymondbacteria bacterium RIFOXYA2_FULL_49_16]OGJ99211.1 MAG: hypothetical protein A2453_07245 [Candidatus Raymondbacteria bacterium RIFOXYC2_FULL_50_21]OGJ99780.1 MAG: hypothetical protein A2519_12615 [Candidatus Raymondbacteria b
MLCFTLSFVFTIPAERYLAISKSGNRSLVKLTDIDSMYFVDTTGLIRGSVLATKAFYHKVGEFNTITITTGIADNGYGADGTDHSGVPASIGNLATDLAFTASVKLTDLCNGDGYNLGIQTDDTLYINATIRDFGGNPETILACFTVIENPAAAIKITDTNFRGATLSQFLKCMQDFLTGTAWNMGGGSNATGTRVAVMPDGKTRIENLGVADGGTSTQDLKDLTITSSRPYSSPYVSSAFSFSPTIYYASSQGPNYSDTPQRMLQPAKSDDYLFGYNLFDNTGLGTGSSEMQIFDNNGISLDFMNNDTLVVSATVGATAKLAADFAIDSGSVLINTSTTLQEMCDAIRAALGLPLLDNTPDNNPSVAIDGSSTDDVLIQNGTIVIRGQPIPGAEITNMTITVRNGATARTGFNANAVLTEF